MAQIDELIELTPEEQESLSIQEDAKKVFSSKVPTRTKILLAIAVVVAFFFSWMVGRYGFFGPGDLVSTTSSFLAKISDYLYYLINDPSVVQGASIDFNNDERVLFLIRFPRILVVMLVGSALAVAGASYQGMFKNPLTSPDLLGASAGASLGACLALLFSLANGYVQLFAFLGGMIAVGLAVWLNKQVGYDPTLGLVLAGILVGTLFQSGMSIIKMVADTNDKLPEITFWLMGSFADVNVGDLIVLGPMIIGFVLLISQSWKLNVLSFGDEEARAMGINTARTRVVVIFAATLVTAASVAVAGIVGWIGLVVPHLARAIVGPNYKVLLPTSMFVGSVFLLIVDDFARLLLALEIPIGILTAILGVPFFVFIFKRNMRGWN